MIATAIPYLVMFLVMLVLDWIWAKYNQATTRKQPWTASFYAVAIYLLGALGTLSFIDNKWLLIPACAGAFVGTFIATKEA